MTFATQLGILTGRGRDCLRLAAIAKGASAMARKIRAKNVQIVFEARYSRGYRYLDRCGEAMLILEDLLNTETGQTWMPQDMRPTGAKMACPDWDVTMTFDAYHCGIEQSPCEREFDFPHVCEVVLATVMARFDIRVIDRLGYRRIWLFPTDSLDEAGELSASKSPFDTYPCAPPDPMKLKSVEAVAEYEDKDANTGFKVQSRPFSRPDAPVEADPRLRLHPHQLPVKQREALVEQLRRRRVRFSSPEAGLVFDVDYYQIQPARHDVQSFLSAGNQVMNKFLQAIEDKQ